MNAPVWALEWRQAARRRRLLVLNVAVPFVLVASIALGGAPRAHAAAAYAVLFAMFGVFGAAVPWAREVERGVLGRVVLTGIEPRALLLQRVLADALLDALELLPAALLLAATGRASAATTAGLALALVAGLLFANALGIWLAALADSLAETALFAAVATLLLLHGGGVFRAPAPGSALAVAQSAIPFHHLHDALRGVAGVAPPASGGVAPALWSGAGVLAALGVTALAAPWIAARAARVR
ncbi:MAG: ABC transporter permease [Gemmatimonadetes bacterium]|nr:ABC transporter permease [Gemmatimonadota bacterium]